MSITAPTLRAFILDAIEAHGLEVDRPGARSTRAELDELAKFICSEHGFRLDDEKGFVKQRESNGRKGRAPQPFEERRPSAKALDRAYLLTQSNDLSEARSQLGTEAEVKRAARRWVRWFGSDSITIDKEAGTLNLDPVAVQAVRAAYAARAGEAG